MTRKLLVLVTFIFVLGVAIGLVVNDQRGSRSSAPEVAQGNQSEPDILAEDLELVQGSNGKVEWRVRARSAQYSFDKRIVQVLRPQLSAFLGSGGEEFYLKADLGEINQQGNTVTLKDNIAGQYNGFTLTSDVFDYIGAMKKLYLKGHVTVFRPDFQINATAVEINTETMELTAAGGVTAELVPQGLDALKKEKKR
jgi:LPS export ABC transporter protein LptC